MSALTDLFDIQDVIGAGYYSRVVGARCRRTNAEVALKLLSKADVLPSASGNATISPSNTTGSRRAASLSPQGTTATPSPIGSSFHWSDDNDVQHPYMTCASGSEVKTLPARLKRVRAEYHVLVEQLREKHPFLVQVERIGHSSNLLFFAMKRYRRGTLAQLLRGSNALRKLTVSEEQARFVVCEVLLALEFLHFRGIVYRDLKPENILLSDDMHIVLSDFDLCCAPAAQQDDLSGVEEWTAAPAHATRLPSSSSRPSSSASSAISNATSSLDLPNRTPISPAKTRVAASTAVVTAGSAHHQRSTSFVGTVEYLSPDVYRDEPVTPAIDLWSLGILLYELLFGFTVFRGNDDRDTLFKMNDYAGKGPDAKLMFPLHPVVSEDVKDLLGKLLCPVRDGRLDAEGFRNHPWVTKVFRFRQLREIHRMDSPLFGVAASLQSNQQQLKFDPPRGRYEQYFKPKKENRPSSALGGDAERTQQTDEARKAREQAQQRREKLIELLSQEVVSQEGPSQASLSFFLPIHPVISPPARSNEEVLRVFRECELSRVASWSIRSPDGDAPPPKRNTGGWWSRIF